MCYHNNQPARQRGSNHILIVKFNLIALIGHYGSGRLRRTLTQLVPFETVALYLSLLLNPWTSYKYNHAPWWSSVNCMALGLARAIPTTISPTSAHMEDRLQ